MASKTSMAGSSTTRPAPTAYGAIVSRDAIAELVHRYSDAVVNRSAEDWGSCWAEDSVWVLGPGRDVRGKTAIVDLWKSAVVRFDAIIQLVHNGSVTFDGDRAAGRWYIDERFIRAGGERGILLAHYDDEYVRVDGSWLFASRRLTAYYNGPPDLSAPFSNDVTRET